MTIDLQAINDGLKSIDQLITLVSSANTALPPLSAERDALRAALKADAQGTVGAVEWNALTDDQKTDLFGRLTKLRAGLLDLLTIDPTGSQNPDSIMYKAHASDCWVIILTIIALVGTGAVLFAIYGHWADASCGPVCAPTATASPSLAPRQAETPTPPSHGSPTSTESLTPTSTATPSPSSAAAGAPATTPTPCPCGCPTEEAILLMIILMGTLGGLIHLTTSLAKYVGNRQLLRSWVVYYLLMPAEGAALAPILYLLLRTGVLNGQVTGLAATSCVLNVKALYAFAGLTGVFSKQAIEMLGDVFSTIFKRVQAKDQSTNTKTQ